MEMILEVKGCCHSDKAAAQEGENIFSIYNGVLPEIYTRAMLL